ncbi:MAG: metallophosphoesterase [Armatimonadota bacterium]
MLVLLSSDVLLVALIRICVSTMGRMDYSESFFVWRWWFLALVLTTAGLPIPLWLGALRLTLGGQEGRGGKTGIGLLFGTSLLMWLASGVTTLVLGGETSLLPRPARIAPVEVAIPGLPPELSGLRIAVLSDHHVGPLMTPARARKRLRSFASAHADLVVELGDITEMDPAYQPEAARIVGECKAPLGTYAVPGNFDMQSGTDSLRQEYDKIGVVFLENEAKRVKVGQSDLWIIGVGDPWTGDADLDRALRAVPRRATTVLLAHSPDIIEQAASRNIPLLLSGHLHGGQVVWPFAGPVVGMSKHGTRFAWGHFRIGPTQLVVPRGLGEEAIPLRLFCPPEIAVVTLRTRPT